MKKLIVLSILMLLLAACGGNEEPTATPMPEPTAVPPTTAPEPTAAPENTGSPIDTMTHTPNPDLVEKNWQWERREQAGELVFEVADPEKYLLYFKEDGTFSAAMDCNFGDGRYATPSDTSIFMELGPMTMAECEPDSVSTEMMNMFGPAQDYRFEEDGAVVAFVWVAGGPVDYYRNVATIAAEPIEGDMLSSLEHTADPELVNKPWVWERRDPNSNQSDEIIVPNPAEYALYFNEDGTFFAKMDCNNMQGNYATDGSGSIFMEGGPTTMVFCGEDSLDVQMGQMFGPAQDYRFEEDGQVLVFSWVAGGPIDYYRQVTAVQLPEPAGDAPTGTVTAPDGIFLRTGPGTHYPYVGAAPFGASGEIIGVSQDGEWWLVDAPNQPDGQVWASAAFVEATNTENVPVVTAPPTVPQLTGTPWLWVYTTDPVIGTQPVVDYTNYVILFNDDGTANIQADCNNIQATYRADDSSSSIQPGPTTMVFCGEGSLDTQFMEQLSSAVLYFIQGSDLYLDLPADSGTMRFTPEGLSAPPEEDPPAGEADGSTLYLTSFGPASAPQPVVAGSQITANFDGDQMTGNAGCNNYSGTLVPVSDYFNVSDIITSRQFCEGLMEQEQAYLIGLQAIVGYQWEQNLVGSSSVVTQGQIFYTLPDGSAGVMNFVSTP